MKFHHIGLACDEIEAKCRYIQTVFPNATFSEIVYDPLQRANLCLITISNRFNIELISGDPVKSLLEKGISFYHLCFSVNNIGETTRDLAEKGAIVISKPEPAVLFENRKVAFLHTQIGLIELLEERDA